MRDSVNKEILLCSGFYSLQSVTCCFQVLVISSCTSAALLSWKPVWQGILPLCLSWCCASWSTGVVQGQGELCCVRMTWNSSFCFAARSGLCKLQLLFSPLPRFLWRKVWAIHVTALWLSLVLCGSSASLSGIKDGSKIPGSYRLLWFSS